MITIIPTEKHYVYSDEFRVIGNYLIEKIEIVPNNPNTALSLVCVIHAINKDGHRVSATSDKFREVK